jgi:uncharacterized protein YecE (DUF72 family)
LNFGSGPIARDGCAVKARPPKEKPIRDAAPSLFDAASETAADTPAGQKTTPTSLPPGVLLGTSAFTADGWEGAFYPAGMRPADYLTFYATQFQTVEVDSTFYRTPPAEMVKRWYEKTPPEFVFAVKVPRVITHEKVLVDCDADWNHFLATMEILGEKLGPILFQFGYFNQSVFRNAEEFLARLTHFLKELPKGRRFAVEIRNRSWLDARFADTLREHNVALALIDQSWMPRPWEMSGKFDPITSDFAYVRWLGDRKGIEKVTKTWDKIVVDRRADLANWAHLLRKLAARKIMIFAYANNHYAGFGPGTVKLFRELWGKET